MSISHIKHSVHNSCILPKSTFLSCENHTTADRTHPNCHNGLGLLMEDCLQGRRYPVQRREWKTSLQKQLLPDTEVVRPGQPDWWGGWAWGWGLIWGWWGARHGAGPCPPNTTISPSPGGESSQMPFFRWKHSGCCIKLSGILCQATVRCELTSGSLHRQL